MLLLAGHAGHATLAQTHDLERRHGLHAALGHQPAELDARVDHGLQVLDLAPRVRIGDDRDDRDLALRRFARGRDGFLDEREPLLDWHLHGIPAP